MTTATAILGVVPGLQATALVSRNLGFVKKQFKDIEKPCPGSKIRSQGMGRGLGVGKGKGPINLNRSRNSDMVKLGVTNLVGISLIKPTASMINSL